MRAVTTLLSHLITRVKSDAFRGILAQACEQMTNKRQIRDKFEMLEQEKAVLEEELGNALTLNEDLQVQYEEIVQVLCTQCKRPFVYSGSIIAEEAVESSMSNIEMTKTDSLKKPLEIIAKREDLFNEQQNIAVIGINTYTIEKP